MIFSIRREWTPRQVLWSAAVGACLVAAGCYPAQPRTVALTSPSSEPMGSDNAMRHRDWSPSVEFYPSGTVQAWPTRWPYEGQETDPQVLNVLVDPVLFLAQTIMLPVRVVTEPPFERVNYAGPVVAASYTLMPPLPPEPLPEPQEQAPKPKPKAQHAPYRPFGALRDWWHNTFNPTPSPKPHAKSAAHPPPPLVTVPTTSTEPAETQPTTTEPAATEPATTPSTTEPGATQPGTTGAPM